MRVADLAQKTFSPDSNWEDIPSDALRLETRSDAIQVISNDFQLVNYIERFGNVVVEYDKDANIYRVPEFAGVIVRYNEAKTRDCQRWGCE